MVSRTFTARQPVWIADIAKSAAFKRQPAAAQAGLHGAFAFPLKRGNEVLGVMEFFHRDVREPEPALIDIAESIGSEIGQYIVRMEAEEAVKFMAMHDALTRLPNRAMFNERLASTRKQGGKPREGSAEYKKLMASIVPPYDASKFPNKWRKMWRDQPARTLMAHLGKDSYSHIHYDSEQARTISVREAARLQSFPDGFVFTGTMNPAFRQIGNAVPPLLAKALARAVMACLKGRVAVRKVRQGELFA